MTSAESLDVLTRDSFVRSIHRTAQMLIDRLLELRELNTVPVPAEVGRISEVVERSGIDEARREGLNGLMRDLARGLMSMADDSADQRSGFSMQIQDEELGEVFTRVVLEGVSDIRRREVSSHARNGALLLMVGALETLVASFATALLENFPDRTSDARLTVAEIEGLDSIGAVRRFAIERAVGTLMRGGIADWGKFFATFGVNWEETLDDW